RSVLQPVHAKFLLFRRTHDRYVDLGMLQIAGNLGARYCNAFDARIPQLIQDRLAGDFPDRFGDARKSVSFHEQSVTLPTRDREPPPPDERGALRQSVAALSARGWLRCRPSQIPAPPFADCPAPRLLPRTH